MLRFYPDARNQEFETRFGLPKGAILESAFAPENLEAAIRGRMTDDEWRVKMAQELAKRVPDAPAREIIEEWSAFPGLLEPKNLALMKKLSENCRLVLLTNATTRLARDLESLGIEDEFDLIVNSSEHGFIKPEREIFEIVRERLGCSFRDCVFVDDSMSHVKAANALGMRAHHFSTLTLLRVEMKDMLGL